MTYTRENSSIYDVPLVKGRWIQSTRQHTLYPRIIVPCWEFVHLEPDHSKNILQPTLNHEPKPVAKGTIRVYGIDETMPSDAPQDVKNFMAWGSDPRAPLHERWLYSQRDVRASLYRGIGMGVGASILISVIVLRFLL